MLSGVFTVTYRLIVVEWCVHIDVQVDCVEWCVHSDVQVVLSGVFTVTYRLC